MSSTQYNSHSRNNTSKSGFNGGAGGDLNITFKTNNYFTTNTMSNQGATTAGGASRESMFNSNKTLEKLKGSKKQAAMISRNVVLDSS